MVRKQLTENKKQFIVHQLVFSYVIMLLLFMLGILNLTNVYLSYTLVMIIFLAKIKGIW